MQIGFVGLGQLGRLLARSLLRAGFTVTVHDVDERAAFTLTNLGAIWAPTLADTARDADVVMTCLPSPAIVAEVMTAEGGLLEGLRPGATWIDSSTNDADELRRVAAIAAEAGVSCLEAPVTGGVHLAAAGAITVLAGGDAALVAAHRPLLEAIGRPVIHIGPLGSASEIKVITNMLALTHLVALGEGLMLARRAGIDLRTAFDVIRASSGNSFVHETESQVILNGSYDIGFTMDLACKDLGLAARLGEEHGVPLHLTALVERIFEQARERYGGDAWSPMVVKLLEDALGTPLRAPGFPSRIQ